MRVLFITTRYTKPSYRFRVEQLLPTLAAAGHECHTEILPPSFFDRMSLFKTAAQYDVVVLQKKLLNRLELGVLFGFCKKLVYDFDDAVMFDSNGETDFRRASRFRNVVRAADLVICGNSILADHAKPLTSRIAVLPTPIDTDTFHPGRAEPRTDSVCRIGWTGSRSTNGYLNNLFPLLAKLDNRVDLRILSETVDGFDFPKLGHVTCEFVKWTPENEVSETAGYDIGLMPLPDNNWTRGKCGFKALQYMALGIPAVCSPVGVNSEIITDGLTGCLPKSDEQWLSVLSDLIANPTKRKQIGNAGRARVESAYSLKVVAPQYVAALESVTQDGRGATAA